VLFLVQLLEVEERVLILRGQPKDFLERLEGPIDEAAALVIQAETQQYVTVLEPRQLRPLEQGLVHLDGARHLTALAVHVAQDHVDLERVGVDAGGAAQLLDRQVDLVRDQEVQAQHVMLRVAGLAAVDPAAVAQLVALPGFAHREPDEQGDERQDERQVRSPVHSAAPIPFRSATGRAGAARPRRADPRR
jgi:hypothetical protein